MDQLDDISPHTTQTAGEEEGPDKEIQARKWETQAPGPSFDPCGRSTVAPQNPSLGILILSVTILPKVLPTL